MLDELARGSITAALPSKLLACSVFRAVAPLFGFILRSEGKSEPHSWTAHIFRRPSRVETRDRPPAREVGERPRMTEGLFMYHRITYSEFSSCRLHKLVTNNEWTSAATAASKRRLSTSDTGGKWQHFQLPWQKMHRKLLFPSFNCRVSLSLKSCH